MGLVGGGIGSCECLSDGEREVEVTNGMQVV